MVGGDVGFDGLEGGSEFQFLGFLCGGVVVVVIGRRRRTSIWQHVDGYFCLENEVCINGRFEC